MAFREEHFIFCDLCLAHCSLKAIVEDGKVVGVVKDEESGLPSDPCPLNRGKHTIIGTLNSPDRLKYPLKSVGRKGEGKWTRITWDEALDTITVKLKDYKDKFGPESIAVVLNEPKGMEFAFGQRFATVFGIPNVITPGNVCGVQTGSAFLFTFGTQAIVGDDEGNPRVIIIWGSNPLHTGGSLIGVRRSKFEENLRKDAKLVVIDPRTHEYAHRADIWIRPRPASDGALAMGMIKVIIEEKLYDEDYVSGMTVGFEELQEHIRTFSLEEVEKATWVPRVQIEEVARMYAQLKPGIIMWGNALEKTLCALQTCRAIAILRALTGNVGIQGGEVVINPATFYRPGRFYFPKGYRRDTEKSIGSEFKLAMASGYVPTQSLVKSIVEEKPYAIRMALFILTNPLVTYPDSRQTYEALMKLDFSVVSDIFMTPTAAIADIVLPAAYSYEFDRIGYWPATFGYLKYYPKLVDPPGEAWPDIKIINELAKRLGLKEFWDDWREVYNFMLQPTGISFEELKEQRILTRSKDAYLGDEEFRGFRTPSGKVEIYSNQMKELGYNPIPLFEEVSNIPFAPSKEYPLLMTNAKEEVYILSSYRSVKSLRNLTPDPLMKLHPDTAADAGLRNGDWVYIETSLGRIKQKLSVDPYIDPRVVITAFGWWLPEKGPSDQYGWRESNINVLVPNGPPYEPATGAVHMQGIPCRVYKA